MKCLLVVTVTVVVLLLEVQTKDVHERRKARWFQRTYTETKIQKEVMTALIPSSCVQVAATLPPCKSVRSLWSFPEFGGKHIVPDFGKRQLVQPGESTNPQQIVLAPIDESKSVGWAEYLGLVAPTVTVTEIDLYTTTVADPRTIVTFSVKGCRPSRLPLDLNKCGLPQEEVAANILPSKILSDFVQPTAFSEVSVNDKQFSVGIEPSTEETVAPTNLSAVPTQMLGQVKL